MKRSFERASVLLAVLLGSRAANAQPAMPTPATTAAAPATDDRPPGVYGGAALVTLGAPNLFRASQLVWGVAASTKAFGIGRDYISTDDTTAAMYFVFAPRWSFVDTRDDWAWVGLRVPWGIDLTNSDTTTRQNRAFFGDLALQTAYRHTFVRNERGLALLAGPSGALSFPTSAWSQAAGIQVETELGLGVLANVPLRGRGWLPNLFVSAGGGWQHTFSNATAPYDSTSNAVYRQPTHTAKGVALVEQTNLLSGTLLVHDWLAAGLTWWLSLYDDLALSNSWGVAVPFRYQPTADCVQTSSGCVDIQPGLNAAPDKTVVTTTFGVALSYAAARLVWLNLGYVNTSRSLGEDGTRRSVFYSPDAQFYLSANLLLDALYGRIEQGLRPPPATPAPPP